MRQEMYFVSFEYCPRHKSFNTVSHHLATWASHGPDGVEKTHVNSQNSQNCSYWR